MIARSAVAPVAFLARLSSDNAMTIRRAIGTLLLCGAAAFSTPQLFAQPGSGEYFVYFGTYTRQESKGIYAWRFQPATGKLTEIGLAAETPNPSFLAVHPGQRFLYAASEISNFDGRKTGAVSAFSIDPATGKLSLLNSVASHGTGPCHLAIDRTGKCLLVANYGGGNAASIPIAADGRLKEAASVMQHSGSSVNPKRQQGPHAHSVNISPDNRFAVVADLGLDQVLVYKLRVANGTLEPNDPPFAKVSPGSGPRHFAFHPDGRYAYVINELFSTVTAFRYDARRGALRELETIKTLPQDFTGDSTTAEVVVHPSGRFLYGSNRGHDSLTVFAIDRNTGKLTLVEHVPTQGRTPRNFAIDPTGGYLFAANQNSGSVVVFRIDRNTGRLTPTGDVLKVPIPVCVRFAAARP